MAHSHWILGLTLAAAMSSAAPGLAEDTPAAAGTTSVSASADVNGVEGPVREPVKEAPPPPAADSSTSGGIKDVGPHERPMAVSGIVEIPWWHGIGVGVGGRFEIPIVKNGFIKSINNQFSIEPALTVGYYRSYGTFANRYGDIDHSGVTYIAPMAYGFWSFHFSQKLRAYGGVGIGVDIGIPNSTAKDYGRTVGNSTYFRFDPVVGMFYKFTSKIALRAEVGGYGPKVGMAFFL